MGYQIYDSSKSAYVNIEDHTFCAKSSILNPISSSLLFNPKTYYANDFAGFKDDSSFIKTSTSIFGGKWGNIPLVSTDYFIDASNKALLFADARSCPIPYRRKNLATTSWGTHRIEGSEDLIKIQFIWSSTDKSLSIEVTENYSNGPYQLNRNYDQKSPIIFLDLVGAGGGSGAGETNELTYAASGGGGGAGAFCSVILDLSITGVVTLTLAGASKAGKDGGNSELSFTPSGAKEMIKLTCCGGKAGSQGTDATSGGSGGSGGTFTVSGLSNFSNYSKSNNQNLDVYKDKGILAINWYTGKSGGRGGFKNLMNQRNGSVGGSFESCSIIGPNNFGMSAVALGSNASDDILIGYAGPSYYGGHSTVNLSGTWQIGYGGGGASALSYYSSSNNEQGYGWGANSIASKYSSAGASTPGGAGGVIIHTLQNYNQ